MSSTRKITNKRDIRLWSRRLAGEIVNPAYVAWLENAVVDYAETTEEGLGILSPRGKDSIPTLSRALLLLVPAYKFVPNPAFETECQLVASWLSKLPVTDQRLSVGLNEPGAFRLTDAIECARQEQRISADSASAAEPRPVRLPDGRLYSRRFLERLDGTAMDLSPIDGSKMVLSEAEASHASVANADHWTALRNGTAGVTCIVRTDPPSSDRMAIGNGIDMAIGTVNMVRRANGQMAPRLGTGSANYIVRTGLPSNRRTG